MEAPQKRSIFNLTQKKIPCSIRSRVSFSLGLHIHHQLCVEVQAIEERSLLIGKTESTDVCEYLCGFFKAHAIKETV